MSYYNCNTCECCQPDYDCYETYSCPTVLLNNAGTTGSSLVVNGVGPVLSVKSIVGGPGITVENNIPTNSITISATTGSSNVTLSNAGVVGESLVTNGVGPDLSIKSIVGENGIIVTSTPTGSVTISSNIEIEPTGSGLSLVYDGIGPSMDIKTLNQGQGILLTDDFSNGINIAANISLSSTGYGEDLVFTGNGADLVIKTINQGTGIFVTDFGAGGLEISLDNSFDTTTLTRLGDGESLVINGTGPALTVKGLTGINGSLITSTENLGSTGIRGITTPIGPNTIGIGPTTIFGTFFSQCTVTGIPGTNDILYLPNMSGTSAVGPLPPDTSSSISPRNEHYFIAPFNGRISCVTYGIFNADGSEVPSTVSINNAKLYMWNSITDQPLMRKPNYTGDPNVIISSSNILTNFSSVIASTSDAVRIQYLDPQMFRFNAGDYLMFGLGNPDVLWECTGASNLFFSFIINYDFNSKVLTYFP
jgi:hypothetical protein